MSMTKRITVTCSNPKCKQESDVIIWQSLNAELNPKEKEQLIDGSLFHFKCPYCNYECKLDYGMLYHNMTQKVMVHYANSKENVEEMYQSMNEIKSNKYPGYNLDGYKMRIVTTQNSLIEKAIIFDNHLDDRIIEVIKLFNIANVMEQYPDLEMKETLFYIDKNGDFIIRFISNYPLSAKIDKNTYETLKTEMPYLLEEENDCFEINIEWAKNILLNR